METGWYVCAECGERFYREQGPGPNPTYCSFNCRRKPYERRKSAEAKEATKQRREKRNEERTCKCAVCGKPFIWTSDNPEQTYCLSLALRRQLAINPILTLNGVTFVVVSLCHVSTT